MNPIHPSSLDDATLRRELSRAVADERAATVSVLAHIAEFDSRRLYLDEACSSMHDYCVQVLHLSGSAAYKRIHAARAARRFPRLFTEVAEGRLHLSAVCLLAPHLTEGNVDTLIAGAVHRSKLEIEVWLARHFSPPSGAGSVAPLRLPRARVTALRSMAPAHAPAPAPAGGPGGGLPGAADPLFSPDPLPPGEVDPAASAANGDPAAPGGRTLPAAPEALPFPDADLELPTAPAAYLVRIPIDEATHAVLREVQDLLGHSIPRDDVGAVFRRALEVLRRELLARKAGATMRPRQGTPPAAGTRTRTIPAHVRRVVWARDAGRCTFTSKTGRRCSATRALEYDHVVPFARGGEATAQGLRLRCRAHNQLEAERAFGTELMQRKRAQARASSLRSPGGP